MNKKNILLIFLFFILLSFNGIAKADESLSNRQSIAIIDTALSSNVLILKNRVIHEVCILENGVCPNGDTFMEGPGASVLPNNILRYSGFDHGTLMATTFALNNKDTDIVFIRIVGNTSEGRRLNTSAYGFNSALEWIISNKDVYNIQAVSMSQSSNSNVFSEDYCPKYASIENNINKLYDMGIPIFNPTGNDRYKDRISWPACVDKTISVGSTNKYNQVASWTNIDVNKTDFYTTGIFDAININNKKTTISGTSVSNQIAAANWMTIKNKYKDFSYNQIYKFLSDSSVNIYVKDNYFGKMINMNGVTNGR